jgi:hypothetical protein
MSTPPAANTASKATVNSASRSCRASGPGIGGPWSPAVPAGTFASGAPSQAGMQWRSLYRHLLDVARAEGPDWIPLARQARATVAPSAHRAPAQGWRVA